MLKMRPYNYVCKLKCSAYVISVHAGRNDHEENAHRRRSNRDGGRIVDACANAQSKCFLGSIYACPGHQLVPWRGKWFILGWILRRYQLARRHPLAVHLWLGASRRPVLDWTALHHLDRTPFAASRTTKRLRSVTATSVQKDIPP